MTHPPPAFVATLGGKAQVVTFALDALLRRGVSVSDVVVLHIAPPDPTHRLHRALLQLQKEFAGDRYAGRRCRLRAVPLRDRAAQRLPDLHSDAAVAGAWRTIHEVIGELKAQGRLIHLCLTGGRRLMAMLAMSVAALHFTYDDRVWHLYTPDALREAAGEGAIMHAAADGPQPFLLDVPIMPGSEYFPALRQLLSASPEEVIAARRHQLEESDRARCGQVWTVLTPRQREVLVLLARGASPQDVAAALCITLATVNSHQHAIYNACREAWALPEATPLDYHWLEQRFGRWPALPAGSS